MKKFLLGLVAVFMVAGAGIVMSGQFEDLHTKTYITPNIQNYATTALPAAGLKGRIAFDTTLGALTVDNGAAWVPLSSGTATATRTAAGTVTLDGTNPSTAATGLTSIVACSITDVRSDTPGADPSQFTYTISTGSINVYAWKITAVDNGTLAASTDSNDVIGYVCVGT
jgi:hypothetical protein